MEILNQLENKVNALIARCEVLQEENAQLQRRLDSVVLLDEDNARLKAELEEERQKNQAALDKINSILLKITNLPE